MGDAVTLMKVRRKKIKKLLCTLLPNTLGEPCVRVSNDDTPKVVSFVSTDFGVVGSEVPPLELSDEGKRVIVKMEVVVLCGKQRIGVGSLVIAEVWSGVVRACHTRKLKLKLC